MKTLVFSINPEKVNKKLSLESKDFLSKKLKEYGFVKKKDQPENSRVKVFAIEKFNIEARISVKEDSFGEHISMRVTNPTDVISVMISETTTFFTNKNYNVGEKDMCQTV